MSQNGRFRHESLQDRKRISTLLKALTSAIAKGEVVLEDADGKLEMKPADLLHLRISGSVDDEQHRINIRISWHGDHDLPKGKPVKIKSG